ncbi:cytoplasmic tRNA 2-thiolation protein 2 [Lutzomyia longipalpis]|uniref:cytoplasmic tRNA 2-thiolation protein 2 n=1 Tax=Lutzomyia longipalpis TaxID=7200 RepID=UPI0024834BB3|nr:cytoplasmic tRNA 2-thiolation protein 2 [Lutzomyia longipalpis]
MCSIGNEDFEDDAPPSAMMQINNKQHDVVDGNCKKCGSPAMVKLPFKEAQCKECFLYYIRHKFRANLSSRKILPRNCSVLTIFDGSPESICLLDLVTHSLRAENYKRLNFNHHIVILDRIFLRAPSLGNQEVLERFFQQFPCDMHYLSLLDDECCLEMFNIRDFMKKLESQKDKLARFQSTFDNQSAWEDFMEQRTKNYIRKAASSLGCGYVFLPDTARDVATNVLNCISLGRGASMAYDVGFLDDRINDCKLLRPIRDFTQEEVDNYIRMNEVQCLPVAATSRAPDSIQSITEKFIDDLQQNYSSTVSTVFRTGDKLAPKQSNEGKCINCHSNFLWENSKTLNAVEFSAKVSNSHENSPNEFSSGAKKFCYACQKTFQSCST